MLILPTHHHRISVYLLTSSSIIYFFKDMKIFIIQVFYLLGQSYSVILYYLRHHGRCCFPDFFLNLFVICIQKSYNFFELIMYSVTSVNMFVSCKSSLVEILGSLMYSIIYHTPNLSRPFIIKGYWTYQRLFQHLLR